jgi:hypothetical protein
MEEHSNGNQLCYSIRTLNDVQVDPLDSSKNKNILKYEHSSGKFVLISADNMLSTGIIPEVFVDTVQGELDLTRISSSGIDGGSF